MPVEARCEVRHEVDRDGHRGRLQRLHEGYTEGGNEGYRDASCSLKAYNETCNEAFDEAYDEALWLMR